MKQQVLKALANPAQVFYVPYSLAVLNFVIQFLAFVTIFVVRLIFTGNDTNPLYFFAGVISVHMIIATFAKKDPQLGQIVSAKLNLLKHKVPRKLAA